MFSLQTEKKDFRRVLEEADNYLNENELTVNAAYTDLPSFTSRPDDKKSRCFFHSRIYKKKPKPPPH